MRLSSKQRPPQVSLQLLSDGMILGPNQAVGSHCMLALPKQERNNRAGCELICRGLCLGERRTAGPSTTLRSGRDDKGEGGDFY